MCELMGLCFAKPISADFSIREFARRGQENADGWGLAWYPDQSVTIVKEPREWRQSRYSDFLETDQGIESRLYIAHVRHKTTGGAPTHADTHPFARELLGREYCFAHNGTLEGPFWNLPLGRFRPMGSTDSEHLFCHLLDELAERDGQLACEEDFRWLHTRLTSINQSGRLNCLLSDGQKLLAYHDARGWKGLSMRKIHFRNREVRSFEDPTLRVDLEGESVNHGYVLATVALSASGWHSFKPSELIVIEAGTIKFSSHRRGTEPAPAAPVDGPSPVTPGGPQAPRSEGNLDQTMVPPPSTRSPS